MGWREATTLRPSQISASRGAAIGLVRNANPVLGQQISEMLVLFGHLVLLMRYQAVYLLESKDLLLQCLDV